ncbi:MAG: type II toxin-antitoxin system VapC family toxin [Acidobacteriota bacterium]|nr:type II toxin-antitoxin system VapC family toxin [Blastocatellia bacterium]MDW8241464.1 type II toxin-antitoxin system VapC family toxin [Acidobacteriota bacterium]
MRALLDTDTVSLIWRHKHPAVWLNVSRYLTQYGHLTFTELTYYEVARGLRTAQATKQLTDFEVFCQQHELLPLTHAAVVRAADIWADLKHRGQLIGEVDVLIAGIAMSEGVAIVSRNIRHFGRIAGLTVIDWTQ